LLDAVELVPQFQAALWGGRKLAHLPNAPSEGPIAEAWLVSDLPHRPSRVANGPYAGQTLSELIAGHGSTLLGKHAARFDTFPLLVKLIDARLPLSVQVHPDDARAQQLAGVPFGKTEAWIVVEADPGSRIYAGLREGVGPNELAVALKQDRIEEVLHSFEPQPGDVVYLPAGTIHALGGGVAIFEVQQTCDVTYRLYDWGRPRELHIAEALACVDFDRGPVQPIRSDRPMFECEYFRMALHRSAVEIGGDDSCRVLVSIWGRTTGCVDVYQDGAMIVPASAGLCRLTPESGAWLFEVSIP